MLEIHFFVLILHHIKKKVLKNLAIIPSIIIVNVIITSAEGKL